MKRNYLYANTHWLKGGIRLLKEHIQGLSIISVLLTILGLVLMYSSISNSRQYDMLSIIIGSILFGAGLLIAILTYFSFVLFGKKERSNSD